MMPSQQACRNCDRYDVTTSSAMGSSATESTIPSCPYVTCPYEREPEYTYVPISEPPKIDKPKPNNLQKRLQKQMFKAIQNSHRRK